MLSPGPAPIIMLPPEPTCLFRLPHETLFEAAPRSTDPVATS